MKTVLAMSFLAGMSFAGMAEMKLVEFRTTGEGYNWAPGDRRLLAFDEKSPLVKIDTRNVDQTVLGFGVSASELSYDALAALSEADRKTVLDALFSPDGELRLSYLRLPIGASDFARDYYSCDDTPGDFSMSHFSLDRDRKGILPLAKAASARCRELFVWASPWTPPKWMKRNGHYAMCPSKINGLAEKDRILEGEDGFIVDDRYFAAYALYFRKFVEGYRAEGVNIRAVMPQNEPNSNQNYPACCWKPATLARFMGRFLGPAMRELGCELWFGTFERGNYEWVETVFADESVRSQVSGFGCQWAGAQALDAVRARHPQLLYIQSEQECGNGKNDWYYGFHSWNLTKKYFTGGVSVYMYWNLALTHDAKSAWGWSQNSLVTVDREKKCFRFNPDFYVMRHLSAFVRKGARRIRLTGSSHYDALAFVNPDRSVVLAVDNKYPFERVVSFSIDGERHAVSLRPTSLNTLVLTKIQ